MTRHKLSRLRAVQVGEITWRLRERADVALTRIAASVKRPAWRRQDLAPAMVRESDLSDVLAHLRGERWRDAHVALGDYIRSAPTRFLIAPRSRERIAQEITNRFPDSVAHAVSRAERLLHGRYDVLGYTDVPFDGRSWHTDHVHGRTAPGVFWSQVPYLDSACGDHKVTWEFNRHQHWLQLGRAYWLSGDRRYRAEFIAQLESWLAANPPRMGTNWASMLELGFRSLSWLWALNFFADGAETDDTPWLVDLLLGLDRQLTHVERHLSYYFSPNTHLIGEAVALYVTGRALPQLRASSRREATGRRVLLEEIGRQIAADGGHCERSTHYHRYTLDFYLLALAVARLTNDPVAGLFERACARLAHAARALADDEGRLPHIGDDDGGSVLPITRRATDDIRDSLAIAAALTGRTDVVVDDAPEEVWWVLGDAHFADGLARVKRATKSSPLTSLALPTTGYYISRNEHGDHLVIDGGPHGYLNGGHAHADALSLTFTYRHRPLLIDTGTGCYTIDPAIRDRFRSSALHNTLTLDAQSQSIPRGPFHWQHQADAAVRRWRVNSRFDYFAGTHDGYAPLMHFRHVLMLQDDVLVIADAVVGNGRGRADVHWHLDPAWTAIQHERGAHLTTASNRVDLAVAGGTVESFYGDEVNALGWNAPAYGRIEPTTTLRVTAEGVAPLWIVSLFSLDPSNRALSATVEPLEASGDSLHHGARIHVERERSTDRVLIAEPHVNRRHGRWRAGDIETDAHMLYIREVDGAPVAMALVDASSVHSDVHPQLARNYPSRVADLYVALDPQAGSLSREKRKAS